MMDRWERVYFDENIMRCPVCGMTIDFDRTDFVVDDFRHCPNCGERLAPPEGE